MLRNIVAFMAFALLPFQAHALSCQMPKLDQGTFDQSALIFEGRAIDADEIALGTPISQYRSYTFTVDRLWKGEGVGETIEVERDVYWGDGFQADTPYLIVAERRDGRYVADICGNSMKLEDAHQQKEFLNKHVPNAGE